MTCSSVDCRADADCPPDRACINKRCEDPCAIENPCHDTSECKVLNHIADCTCPPGFKGSRGTACAKGKFNCFSSYFGFLMDLFKIIFKL